MSNDKMATTGILLRFQATAEGKLRAIIEFEPELADDAYRALGGHVLPGDSRHVGICVLNLENSI